MHHLDLRYGDVIYYSLKGTWSLHFMIEKLAWSNMSVAI